MSKRIELAAAIVGTLTILFSPFVVAQSKSDGERLFWEAQDLEEQARSNEELTKVVQKYEKALQIFREEGDLTRQESTLVHLGEVYEELGEYAKAVGYYQEALEAVETILEVQRSLGDAAPEIASSVGDYDPEKVWILTRLGYLYSKWRDYSKGVEYYEQGLEIAKSIGNEEAVGRILNSLGDVCLEWGRPSKAVKHYEKALEIARSMGAPSGVARMLNNLGNVYTDWGQHVKSIQYYEEALEIAKTAGDKEAAGRVSINLGNVYSEWGQRSKAVEYYEQGLGIARSVGDEKAIGSAYLNLGRAYQGWHQYEKALYNYQQALEIESRIGESTYDTTAYMADLYLDMGQMEKAANFAKKSGVWAALGRLALARFDYLSAKENYEKLMKSWEQSGRYDALFVAYTGLACSYEGMGDLKTAEHYFRKAMEHVEQLRSTISPENRETFFDVRQAGFLRTAPYEGLARVLTKMRRGVEASKISEYTKARVFAEALYKWTDGVAFDLPEDIFQQDREVNDQITALKKRRKEAYEQASQEDIAALEREVTKMEDKLQAHIRMLREKYPLFGATKYPEPMNLAETGLKENEWVLGYHVTDPGIIIYLFQGKRMVKALFKPAPRDELNSLVLRFREPLEMARVLSDDREKREKSFDLDAAKDLADLLLSDILESLPSQVPLVIIPDDCLGILPFEMLVLNKGSTGNDRCPAYGAPAEYFGDRNTLSYYQSITALTLVRIYAKQRGSHDKLLLIADPVFDLRDERVAAASQKGLPTGIWARMLAHLFKRFTPDADRQMGGIPCTRLGRTAELVNSLRGYYRERVQYYDGLDASKSNFLKNIAPGLQQYDKVIFATHGYFGKDVSGIMEPFLILTLVPPGTDGYLRMTEVMGLNMNADIVALTACQTGLGTRLAGEGTIHMGRAFQYAGARSVLTSLWSVSEVTSVTLMKSFFGHLKEGKSKREALSLARKEVRKKYDHPFFWAAFILVGEAN